MISYEGLVDVYLVKISKLFIQLRLTSPSVVPEDILRDSQSFILLPYFLKISS